MPVEDKLMRLVLKPNMMHVSQMYICMCLHLGIRVVFTTYG